MKNGSAVFFAVLLALGASWTGFVVAPAIQLGKAKQTAILNSSDIYPLQRTGEATLGLQIYRANGCAACHTEQIRQDGVIFEVALAGAGKKDPTAVSNLVSTLKLSGLTKEEADAAGEKIKALGGKVETHLTATGADIARGWGVRRSVATDFLYDSPVQLGAVRVGPDLANVRARLPDANWQLAHLYAPRIVPNSGMPSFKFLFEVRKIGSVPSVEALNLPKEFAPADGDEVVPKLEAKQLVAYLLSLRADAPLYEAPFSPAQVSTNAPAK
jgi:cbb3-type cytochrome oxidase cytochrome c subunit